MKLKVTQIRSTIKRIKNQIKANMPANTPTRGKAAKKALHCC